MAIFRGSAAENFGVERETALILESGWELCSKDFLGV